MGLPILTPLRDLLGAQSSGAAERVVVLIATAVLAMVGVSLGVAAGLVALSAAIGFPLAALVFAGGFIGLSWGVHMMGHARSARRATQIAAARQRTTSEIAVAMALAKSARPLLPLAAFAAAFLLARRP